MVKTMSCNASQECKGRSQWVLLISPVAEGDRVRGVGPDLNHTPQSSGAVRDLERR